ncbi:hypothetical protein ARMGADRAFT_1068696 [Armillaria gallica]|uniref:DUF6534 domain-containing protein n=1 Tax=Armillaria gallica TaxID=47427 RepID=A0A2H3CID1_ARMGA|nr:hypothetical protein ARMGADRAFT_1068696 [Armillaria gallica]
MSSQCLTAAPSLHDTFGALFVGAIVATMLFGITNVQTLIYYKRYPNDWSLFRYSVALLWGLDALHVALSTHALYYYLIDMYGNLPGALGNNTWSMKLQLAVNVSIIVYVQGLYAMRLWKLGRNFHKILPWFVVQEFVRNCTLVLSHAANANVTVVTYDIYITPNLADISIVKKSIYTFFSTIAITDFIVALMMCYYLHKSRGDTMFSSTAAVILRLTRLILVSGLATSACSLLALIAYIVWPETLIFLGIDFVLPKLYINSLLAMFNYRRKHVSSKSIVEHVGNSTPTILRITPHSSERDSEEINIGIPLSELQDAHSFDNNPNHSKGALDYKVEE